MTSPPNKVVRISPPTPPRTVSLQFISKIAKKIDLQAYNTHKSYTSKSFVSQIFLYMLYYNFYVKKGGRGKAPVRHEARPRTLYSII